MNMNKALQNLYYAVSGSTTTKVNISKLLVDIHYAITGKESENKNNWSRIINSMADNWPEGGGGSSDFSTATVNFVTSANIPIEMICIEEGYGLCTATRIPSTVETLEVVLYRNEQIAPISEYANRFSVSGNASIDLEEDIITITGDCTITYTP